MDMMTIGKGGMLQGQYRAEVFLCATCHTLLPSLAHLQLTLQFAATPCSPRPSSCLLQTSQNRSRMVSALS